MTTYRTMVRQEFHVDKYWRVIVYYDVDYSFLELLNKELKKYGFSKDLVEEMWYMLSEEEAKAATCSSISNKISFVFFNPHDDREDYINSIIHEAVHVKQAILEAYDVEDEGEAPAYTMGYLVMRMYEVFKHLVICKD